MHYMYSPRLNHYFGVVAVECEAENDVEGRALSPVV